MTRAQKLINKHAQCGPKGETFRFSKDEDDHDHEICAYVRPIVILSGKLDSRRHSTTRFCKKVVVAETSYQILEVLSF